MTDRETALACLAQISPTACDYEEWLQVGMACKDVGITLDEWNAWSAQDIRHKPREMPAKWASFRGSSTHPVGLGTLVHLCRKHGGDIEGRGVLGPSAELEWDAVIGPQKLPLMAVVRPEWVEDAPLGEPDANWNGAADFARYLRAIFNADERVGIVTESWLSDPDKAGATRWLPKRGIWDRTAGELLELLASTCDLGSVVGDWNPEAGAWVRFNPLDGEGCADANITEHRFALVECDDLPIERQNAIYRQLELPIAALVHSGGKSLHAIVRVEARDFAEYQKRVDFLYDVCRRNGLAVDRKNRNPSRLSRLPGATRNGREQWLVETNIGRPSWTDWEQWIEAINDDLPDVEVLAEQLASLPPLAAPIIDGLLRRGHKMLVAGPSKAGKSFQLLQLAVAIAEGREWLGWQCAKGRCLYVNLELDRASCLHRLRDVYAAMNLVPRYAGDIDLWHLRGKSMPMTELAPRLIRRALKRQYSAIIIDPIYKVITGDENAAHEMAKFCNQFDRVCAELKAAVIYCHHHSKGSQGQKQAHDRASGSGVFARDPDALLDLIELEIDDARRKQVVNVVECDAMAAALSKTAPGWSDECPQDDAIVANRLADWAETAGYGDLVREVRPRARAAAEQMTGWRIEGILREFPAFPPRRVWFRYPVHTTEHAVLLEDAVAAGELAPKPAVSGAKKSADVRASTRQAIEACRQSDGTVAVDDVAEYLGLSRRGVQDRALKAGFRCRKGMIEERKADAE